MDRGQLFLLLQAVIFLIDKMSRDELIGLIGSKTIVDMAEE
jgi:hypothetical protein